VTKDNANAPWLLFECGALSNPSKTPNLCPYLHRINASELPTYGPLSEFQVKLSDRDGTLSLVKAINDSNRGATLSDAELKKRFVQHWPKLESELGKIDSEGELQNQFDDDIYSCRIHNAPKCQVALKVGDILEAAEGTDIVVGSNTSFEVSKDSSSPAKARVNLIPRQSQKLIN